LAFQCRKAACIAENRTEYHSIVPYANPMLAGGINAAEAALTGAWRKAGIPKQSAESFIQGSRLCFSRRGFR